MQSCGEFDEASAPGDVQRARLVGSTFIGPW